MKSQIRGLLLLGGMAMCAPAQAQDDDGGWFGWFGWFTPGEWFSGAEGLYIGTALNVTKLTGQLDRRLGGENDPGGFSIEEPGFNTTIFVRGGWKPVDFLAVEAQYGVDVDSDRIENDNNSQQLKLDSLYGIYLKPQFTYADSITVFGTAGFSDFEYDIRCHSTEGSRNPDPACENRKFSDSGFAWGGGLELVLSAGGRLGFEYQQHYDENDSRVFGVGISVSFLFGQESEDDGYYY